MVQKFHNCLAHCVFWQDTRSAQKYRCALWNI